MARSTKHPNSLRVTFSISGVRGDVIARLYETSIALGVHAVSAIRHDLLALEAVLNEAEGRLTGRERDGFNAAVELLSYSYLCQVEGVPSPSQLSAYARSVNRPDVMGFINGSTTTRLMLLMDRARRLRVAHRGEAHDVARRTEADASGG